MVTEILIRNLFSRHGPPADIRAEESVLPLHLADCRIGPVTRLGDRGAYRGYIQDAPAGGDEPKAS